MSKVTSFIRAHPLLTAAAAVLLVWWWYKKKQAAVAAATSAPAIDAPPRSTNVFDRINNDILLTLNR